jgi:hypothetical protein
VGGKVSRPYKTSDRIMVFLHFNIYMHTHRREDKRLWTEWLQIFSQFIQLLTSLCMQFRSVSVVPKYFNIATSLKDLFVIFMPWFCPCIW